ncbi:cytidine deaminase, partial [Gorgonomyces haynaldii]
MTLNIEQLRQEAIAAREFSYSPYSKFRVGCALLGKSGKIYRGCNVENASYGGTICAERTAVLKAVSEGERSFAACAVITDKTDTIPPCGFCRQFLREFGKDLPIYMFSTEGHYTLMTLDELL